jgi:hypothetical protein
MLYSPDRTIHRLDEWVPSQLLKLKYPKLTSAEEAAIPGIRTELRGIGEAILGEILVPPATLEDAAVRLATVLGFGKENFPPDGQFNVRRNGETMSSMFSISGDRTNRVFTRHNPIESGGYMPDTRLLIITDDSGRVNNVQGAQLRAYRPYEDMEWREICAHSCYRPLDLLNPNDQSAYFSLLLAAAIPVRDFRLQDSLD